MKKDVLIVKANQVVEAGYHLTTSEQRLILSAISKIPKGVEVSDESLYVVTVEDFKEFGVHPKTAYRDLREACERIYERSINLKIGNNIIKTRWVQQIAIGDQDWLQQTSNMFGFDMKIETDYLLVCIRFSKQIAPYLSNFTREFTKYLKSDIAGVSSAYTIRFYELICQYRSIGKREISIKDLRHMLQLENKYTLFADLKRWVIDTSVNEINEKTPMSVSYEVKKTGRRVTHLKLVFKEKTITKKNCIRNSNAFNSVIGQTGNEAKKTPSWQKNGLSDGQIKKIGCNIREFVDANSSKVSPSERGGYSTVFDDWKPLLKDPKTVGTFNMVQELLDRQK